MKVEFKNFGKSGSGEIELKDLTVIWGPNNSGKTFISHTLYFVLQQLVQFDRHGLIGQISKELKKRKLTAISYSKIKIFHKQFAKVVEKYIDENIWKFFGANAGFVGSPSFKIGTSEINFKQFPSDYRHTLECGETFSMYRDDRKKQIILKLDVLTKDKKMTDETINDISRVLCEILFFSSVQIPFPISSERVGIGLFFKANDDDNDKLNYQFNQVKNVGEHQDNCDQNLNFSHPIRDSISHVRWYYENIRVSFLSRRHEKYRSIFDCMNGLLDNGEFRLVNNSIYYKSGNAMNDPETPLKLTASSTKALFMLHLFINHVATDNSVLVIDEPELNLHPDKQIIFTHLIARLVNAGIKVILTTHSVFLLREINNLISLSSVNDKKSEIMKKYNIIDEDILKRRQLSVYTTKVQGGFSKLPVRKRGIAPKRTNKFIIDENTKAQEISLHMDS